jgi:hypothetical protein
LAASFNCHIDQFLRDVDIAVVIDPDFGDDIDGVAPTDCVFTDPN